MMAETHDRGGRVQHLNPPALHGNPAFTQVVAVSGPATTIYVGGQNAVDAAGIIVGEGDIVAQTRQAFANLEAALAAAGAALENIVRWTMYLVQGQPIGPGFAVFQEVWGRRPNPPAIVVLVVAGLANPAFLVEIDAIAVVPEQQGERQR
jgi:enamine deaminase RidA (YjgF/YER057c/UK114 family)